MCGIVGAVARENGRAIVEFEPVSQVDLPISPVGGDFGAGGHLRLGNAGGGG